MRFFFTSTNNCNKVKLKKKKKGRRVALQRLHAEDGEPVPLFASTRTQPTTATDLHLPSGLCAIGDTVCPRE